MGFGWVLAGYFFANIMAVYSPLAVGMLVGYPLMIAGLYKLAPYHKRFYRCFIFSFFTLPFALYFGVYGVFRLVGAAMPALFTGTVYDVTLIVYYTVSTAFQLLLLSGVAGLSAELGLTDLQSGALRDMILVALTPVLTGFFNLPAAWIKTAAKYAALPVLILWVLTIFMVAWLLWDCYRKIGPAEEAAAAFEIESEGKEGDDDDGNERKGE